MLQLTTSTSKEGGKASTLTTFRTPPTQVTSLGAGCHTFSAGHCWGQQTFSLAGIDETLSLGIVKSKSYSSNPPSGWMYIHLPPAAGSGSPNNSSIFDAAIPTDRMWALVKQAFDQDLLLAASGWVEVDTVAPTEAQVREAMARAAAGEQVVIPAASARRTLHVTSVTLTRPPRAAGGGGASGSSSLDPSQ
jgi:hypothetical protein